MPLFPSVEDEAVKRLRAAARQAAKDARLSYEFSPYEFSPNNRKRSRKRSASSFKLMNAPRETGIEVSFRVDRDARLRPTPSCWLGVTTAVSWQPNDRYARLPNTRDRVDTAHVMAHTSTILEIIEVAARTEEHRLQELKKKGKVNGL